MSPKTKPYHSVVLAILAESGVSSILDAPCGHGWLGHALQSVKPEVHLDGVGLWEFPEDVPIYQSVKEHDLDEPLPDLGKKYDAVVCGEAIHLVTNPGLLIKGFRDVLNPGGKLIITTPNTWFSRSRGQFLLRGFHSGFSPMIGKQRGDYITYFPFSFPQLHLLLQRYGFENITLHDVDEPKPKHALEHVLAWPGRMYCRRRAANAANTAEAIYWRQAASAQSLHGRWLVMSAMSPQRLGEGRG
ncbi:class I SAM-dependent methyltransferase [Bordetella tumulicola]|uniref:class I SAM-dependent methyltransferase n=1 Tax=Bordetella tumulicola TaxID=1649133 RepID=UPI0039F14150